MSGQPISLYTKPERSAGRSVSGASSGRGTSAARLIVVVGREIDTLAIAFCGDRHQLIPDPSSAPLISNITQRNGGFTHKARGSRASDRSFYRRPLIAQADLKSHSLGRSSGTGRTHTSCPFFFPSQKLRTSGMVDRQAGFGHVTVLAQSHAMTVGLAIPRDERLSDTGGRCGATLRRASSCRSSGHLPLSPERLARTRFRPALTPSPDGLAVDSRTLAAARSVPW